MAQNAGSIQIDVQVLINKLAPQLSQIQNQCKATTDKIQNSFKSAGDKSEKSLTNSFNRINESMKKVGEVSGRILRGMTVAFFSAGASLYKFGAQGKMITDALKNVAGTSENKKLQDMANAVKRIKNESNQIKKKILIEALGAKYKVDGQKLFDTLDLNPRLLKHHEEPIYKNGKYVGSKQGELNFKRLAEGFEILKEAIAKIQEPLMNIAITFSKLINTEAFKKYLQWILDELNDFLQLAEKNPESFVEKLKNITLTLLALKAIGAMPGWLKAFLGILAVGPVVGGVKASVESVKNYRQANQYINLQSKMMGLNFAESFYLKLGNLERQVIIFTSKLTTKTLEYITNGILKFFGSDVKATGFFDKIQGWFAKIVNEMLEYDVANVRKMPKWLEKLIEFSKSFSNILKVVSIIFEWLFYLQAMEFSWNTGKFLGGLWKDVSEGGMGKNWINNITDKFKILRDVIDIIFDFIVYINEKLKMADRAIERFFGYSRIDPNYPDKFGHMYPKESTQTNSTELWGRYGDSAFTQEVKQMRINQQYGLRGVPAI